MVTQVCARLFANCSINWCHRSTLKKVQAAFWNVANVRIRRVRLVFNFVRLFIYLFFFFNPRLPFVSTQKPNFFSLSLRKEKIVFRFKVCATIPLPLFFSSLYSRCSSVKIYDRRFCPIRYETPP